MAIEEPRTQTVSACIRQVCISIASMHEKPSTHATRVNEVLYGALVEILRVEDESPEWLYVRVVQDGYEGFMRQCDVTASLTTPTHYICTPSTITRTLPKTPANEHLILYMSSHVRVLQEQEENGYLCTDAGWADRFALVPIGTVMKEDLCTLAEWFLRAPYNWAGRTVRGPDCSGWLQVVLQVLGIDSPRDTAQMQKVLGEPILLGSDLSSVELQQNDLIFWKDHVAVYRGDGTIIHATAAHKRVLIESLQDAVDMRHKNGNEITCVRRLSFN